MKDISKAKEARMLIRNSEWEGTTVGKVPGYVQCGLLILPFSEAYDFLVYCQRNPKPCPLIEVTDTGAPEPRLSAKGADLRTDLASYTVYREGKKVEEREDISDIWREDFVAFLFGSSLTFDAAMKRAGVDWPSEVWIFETNIDTVPAGKFSGKLLVTMRYLSGEDTIIATQVTARFPRNHGAPVHIGEPGKIGVKTSSPIYGKPVETIPEGVMPVFWACSVTAQRAAISAKPQIAISHTPGYGFITDILESEVSLP